MARFKYQDVMMDGNGKVIIAGSISVFLSGTTTPAWVYTASSGGVAVDVVTSGTDGYYFFYVDDGDYRSNQKFKLILAKYGFTTKIIDEISIASFGIEHAAVFAVTGTLTFLTSVAPVIIMPWAGSFAKVWAYVKTAPTTQAIIFDVNLNGSTIWSTQGNRVQIAASENLGTQTSFDTTTFSADDILTLDVDQVGTGTAGADATVEIVIST